MTSISTKFDHVVSFGCSLARGDELIDLTKKYSAQIAKKYGAKLIDYSIPGTSNEIISQSLINLLLSNDYNWEPSRTLVLVEWTYCTRLNFCGKSNRYYVIAHHNMDPPERTKKLKHSHTHLFFNDDFDDLLDVKFFYKYHTNLTYLMYNMARNIHHVQMLLKNKGYNYIFLFASEHEKDMICSIDSEHGFNALGLDKSLQHDNYPYFYHTIKDIDTDYICPVAFTEYARKHNYKFGIFNHPLEDGHIAYSKVLFDFIESKYGKQTLRGSQSGVS